VHAEISRCAPLYLGKTYHFQSKTRIYRCTQRRSTGSGVGKKQELKRNNLTGGTSGPSSGAVVFLRGPSTRCQPPPYTILAREETAVSVAVSVVLLVVVSVLGLAKLSLLVRTLFEARLLAAAGSTKDMALALSSGKRAAATARNSCSLSSTCTCSDRTQQ
jgi:hypothetical protein